MPSDHLTPETRLALDAFLLDGKARNLSPRTLEYYRWQLDTFLKFADADASAPLEEITSYTIRSYLVCLQERDLQPASQHAAARAIRAFFNFLVEECWLERSPMARIKMPRVGEKVKPAFTEAEVRSLLEAAASQRDKAIIICLLDSGCRASEFLAWNVSDVNIQTGTVHVRKTKNRSERTVYLGTHARKELLKLYRTQSLEPQEPIWRSHNTCERLGIAGLQIMLRKLGEAVDVIPCNPHRFRRTFALYALRNGMDVFVLQKIMGHSDLTILRRYLALVEDDLALAHQKYGPADNLA